MKRAIKCLKMLNTLQTSLSDGCSLIKGRDNETMQVLLAHQGMKPTCQKEMSDEQRKQKIDSGIQNYDILIEDLLERLTRACNNRAELRRRRQEID